MLSLLVASLVIFEASYFHLGIHWNWSRTAGYMEGRNVVQTWMFDELLTISLFFSKVLWPFGEHMSLRAFLFSGNVSE